MIVSRITGCPADILVHIPDLHIELPVTPVAGGYIGPVLIEYFPVDRRGVPDVEKDLVLYGCEEAFCKRDGCGVRNVAGSLPAQREDGPGKIAYTPSVLVAVLHEGITFRMVFGQEPLFQS